MKTSILLLGGLAAFAGCGTDVKCGDGTTKVGDTCEGTGSGSGNNTMCGAGTHLDGTTCVPDAPEPGGAPAITKIDPTDAGVSGSGLFTITGTNFAGSDITDLHVYFGPMTQDCEAVVGAATPTTIAGEVPPACDLNVVVTVQTSKGMATVPFHYDAIIAVDGDAGGTTGIVGDMYVIDPFNQRFHDLGPVSDPAVGSYAISGLAFSNTTLYAVSTGDSLGDAGDGSSSLMTIDLSAGAATWIAATYDATNQPYTITDIKFNGTTLYGLAYQADPISGAPVDLNQYVVTIDPATGVVTKLSNAGKAQSYKAGGLAVDTNGTVYTATSAAADSALPIASTGELDTVDTGNGSMTSMLTLDYGQSNLGGDYGAPIQAMAYFGTALLAVVDNGTYGVAIADPSWAGETLVMIDPAADPQMSYYVTPLFELPNRPSYQASVDAIVVPPADFTIASRIRHAHWSPLKSSGSQAAAAQRLHLAAHASVVAH